MPPCSDQPKESSAAHANVEAAITPVVGLIRFMAFLRYLIAPHLENDMPHWWRAIAIDQGFHERHDMESLRGASMRGASMPRPADVSVTIIWPSMVKRTSQWRRGRSRQAPASGRSQFRSIA